MIMNWLRKHKKIILYVVMGGFIISTFVGFGLYLSTGSGLNNAVAEVNGQKVSYQSYQGLYNQVVASRRDKGEELSPETLAQIKQEVVQSLIQQTVFFEEAKRYGITVTDGELAQSLGTIPAFQKEGKFDPQAYVQALHFNLRTTPEEFEESQRRQIAIQRLRFFVLQGVKISNAELELEYQTALAFLKGADRDKFLKQFGDKEKFREQLRQDKSAQILNRWYQQLGANLKVKVRLDEIENQVRR